MPSLEISDGFWSALEYLLAAHAITIDRPQGSPHPRYPNLIYPLDYGYLNGTVSGDGEGIDLFLGSAADGGLTAVVCVVDLSSRETEIKLLVNCTESEADTAIRFLHQTVGLPCAVIRR